MNESIQDEMERLRNENAAKRARLRRAAPDLLAFAKAYKATRNGGDMTTLDEEADRVIAKATEPSAFEIARDTVRGEQ